MATLLKPKTENTEYENGASNNNGAIEIKEDDDEICELEHLRKLFIGGLAPYTVEEGLKAFYGQWGKVVDVVVMRDPVTKRSRGFGFITYTKASMVDRAQENRPHVIDGKTVEAKRALPRPERESRETNISVKKLFVGGLKDNHDEPCLQEYFSQFGNVISVKILTDKTTGKRRGFAFIEFDDYDAVDKAILQKNHSIKYVVVDVKKSVYNQEQQNRQNNSNITVANNAYPGKGAIKNAPPPQHGAIRPPQQQPMQPYQQPPPMGASMPPNYNWGPPPPTHPQYAPGYQHQPPPPPTHYNYPPNAWNAPPNSWNAPAPAGPAPNWNWGYPPPAAPVAQPPPPANWNAQQVPPQVPTAPVPPPPASNQVPQQQPPPNFGAGYQQNYGGGPTKHAPMNTNRMNPYNAPPNHNYGNANQPPVAGYGYNAAPPNGNQPPVQPVGPVPKPMPNGAPGQQASGNKYRR